MTTIQILFRKHLHPVRKKLDSEAIKILDDLLVRLPPMKRMEPLPNDCEFFANGMSFHGEECSIAIAAYDGALNEFVEEGNLALVKRNQFSTFAENRLYCEGADSLLLELLIRYRYIETEKAVIASTADVCVWRKDKPSLEPEDLLNSYDKDRTVVTTIVFDSGFIAFTFEKKIKLNA